MRGPPLVTVILLCASAAQAQRPAGRWEGVVSANWIAIALDSGPAGWTGTFVASRTRPNSMPFAAVAITRDSVVLQLPSDVGGNVMHGVISPDGTGLRGRVFASGEAVAAFRLARAGTAAAAQIVAQTAPSPPPGPRKLYLDPDSARLITSDVARFWRAFDAPPDSQEVLFQRYIDEGTPGLKDFVPGRIISAAELALKVEVQRNRYLAARAATLRLREAEPAVRAVYRRLREIYPEAAFPDVYFIVGRFNSAGTASSNGVLLAAEQIGDPAGLAPLVGHEVIHTQQPRREGPPTLLSQSFREGAASFIGALVSGVSPSGPSHTYGMAHERTLWAEFKAQMNGTDYGDWLYRAPPGDRPADLGYFIGYRIAQAYHRNAANKRAAVRDIILVPNLDSLVARSGYDP